ncbi:hypothetical protein [Nocardia sp. NPDC049149]|uniref:hypothetical protein n=1 Tax=Nocardia sp. NPDC049149 TaxID=3364315 RepID=UPI00371DC3DB
MSEAIAQADSPSWSVRAAAGRRLATAPQIEAVADVLHRLLLDPQDTAVTSETAAALLARGDLPGLRAVLTTLSMATDDDIAEQLSAELGSDSQWTAGHSVADLIRRCQMPTSDADQGLS